MKLFVVLTFLLIANSAWASPIFERSHSDHHRWTVTPDEQGRMHMLDLNPLDSPVEPLFVPETDILILLFTNQNPTVGDRLFFNESSVRSSHFNPSNPTRFTTHGWLGQGTDPVNAGVRDAFLQLANFNMITIDWAAGASTPNYITARNRVRPVGEFIARFIDFLHNMNYVRFPELQVIGYSVGGHVVGIVGKSVTGGRVRVIQSLDPAAPLFSVGNPLERVAATDADYVEVMHTNAGLQGFLEPIGQADFYPNFGRSQPGCGADPAGNCAHARSVLLYIESLHSVFTGQECSSFAEIEQGQCTPTSRTGRMGGPDGSIGLTGNYYLTTNDAPPFMRP